MIAPAKREDLRAFALFGAVGGVPRAAVKDDRRHVGVGFDVVQHRGLAPETALRGERRAGTRFAAVAFDRRQQGRLFAADECARTHADFQLEIEARAENVLAHQAAFAGLLQGDFQPFDGQRIFGPHVDEAPAGADGVRGDHHAFHHAVRIAFEHAAVHERAGIAFVGVANHVFHVAFAHCG